jgi:hypothetical protein
MARFEEGFRASGEVPKGRFVALQADGSVRVARPGELALGPSTGTGASGRVIVSLDDEPVVLEAAEAFPAGQRLEMDGARVCAAADDEAARHYALEPSAGPGSRVRVLVYWPATPSRR